MLIADWAVALTLVIVISGAILGFAAAISRLTKPFVSSFVCAVGIFSVTLLVTGVFLYVWWVSFLLVLLGWILCIRYRAEFIQWIKLLEIRDLKSIDFLFLIFPLGFLAARFFSCGVPQEHSDPLYYHLLAPKLWAQWGKIKLTAEHPSFSQATLWELLYGIPILWLHKIASVFHVLTNETRQNIIVQLTGQWMHFFWGQIGCLVLAIRLFGRLSKKAHFGPRVFLAWLCLTLPSIEWTGTVAKNDQILFLFSLAALLEVFEGRFFLSGLFIGFAFSTKIFAFWTGLACFVLIPRKYWPRYIAGATLAAAPILLRNVFFTGDPFFPGFDDFIGPHWISLGWSSNNAKFVGPPDLHWEHLKAMLGWLWERQLSEKLPFALFVLGWLAYVTNAIRKSQCLQKRELLFITIQLFIILLVIRPIADARYATPVLAFLFLFLFSNFLEVSTRILLMLIPLGFFINIPVDVFLKIPRNYWMNSDTKYLEVFHPLYKVHTWINQHVNKDEKILFTMEKFHFYLNRDFEAVPEMKSWESFFSHFDHAMPMLRELQKQGYRYVHFTFNAPDSLSFYKVSDEILSLKSKAVFYSSTSMIIDLAKL